MSLETPDDYAPASRTPESQSTVIEPMKSNDVAAGEADAARELAASGAAGEGDDAVTSLATSTQTGTEPAAVAAGEGTPKRSRARSRSANLTQKSRTPTYVALACVALLVAFTMFGSVLNVGDHLMAAHPALGWVFYALIAVLVVVGIVVPVAKVARRPIFSLYQLRDEQGHAKQRWCRMLVDNLIENANLTDEEAAELESYLQRGDEADDLIIEFFNKHCIPIIDAETKRTATTAFFVSAVAHSPLVSTVTMLSLCLDLVRSIVEMCGFRPTNLGLARLYVRVMASALIVGGIEDSDLSDMLGQVMGGGAGARVGGVVIGSAAEGMVSAFLAFRVGVITKRWLTAADGPARMASLRRASYREALAMMRSGDFMQTVADTVKETSKSVATDVASSVANAAKSKAEAARSAFRSRFSSLER